MVSPSDSPSLSFTAFDVLQVAIATEYDLYTSSSCNKQNTIVYKLARGTRGHVSLHMHAHFLTLFATLYNYIYMSEVPDKLYRAG